MDLLFYHTRLKYYIVVELKAGAFKPEHVGQLNLTFPQWMHDQDTGRPSHYPYLGQSFKKKKTHGLEKQLFVKFAILCSTDSVFLRNKLSTNVVK